MPETVNVVTLLVLATALPIKPLIATVPPVPEAFNTS